MNEYHHESDCYYTCYYSCSELITLTGCHIIYLASILMKYQNTIR